MDSVRAWEYQPYQLYVARNGPIGRPNVGPNGPEVVYVQLPATGAKNLRKLVQNGTACRAITNRLSGLRLLLGRGCSHYEVRKLPRNFHVNGALEQFRLQYKIGSELHIRLGQMKVQGCLRVL